MKILAKNFIKKSQKYPLKSKCLPNLDFLIKYVSVLKYLWMYVEINGVLAFSCEDLEVASTEPSLLVYKIDVDGGCTCVTEDSKYK